MSGTRQLLEGGIQGSVQSVDLASREINAFQSRSLLDSIIDWHYPAARYPYRRPPLRTETASHPTAVVAPSRHSHHAHSPKRTKPVRADR